MKTFLKEKQRANAHGFNSENIKTAPVKSVECLPSPLRLALFRGPTENVLLKANTATVLQWARNAKKRTSASLQLAVLQTTRARRLFEQTQPLI